MSQSVIEDLATQVRAFIRRHKTVELRDGVHAVTVPVAVELVVKERALSGFAYLAEWVASQGEPESSITDNLPRWRMMFFANALEASAETQRRMEVCQRVAAEVEGLIEASSDFRELTELGREHLQSRGVPWLF